MRTTLTLDPDVARLLEEEVHRRRKPFKEVVNDAIRRGLSPRTGRRGAGPYRVAPHKTRLRPGVDAAALNRLAEDLEEEAVVARMPRGRS